MSIYIQSLVTSATDVYRQVISPESGSNWECPPHSLHFWAAARLSDVSPLVQSSVVLHVLEACGATKNPKWRNSKRIANRLTPISIPDSKGWWYLPQVVVNTKVSNSTEILAYSSRNSFKNICRSWMFIWRIWHSSFASTCIISEYEGESVRGHPDPGL